MIPGADPVVTAPPGISLPERYEPIRRVGSGGMATVWCAHDRTLDRPVAIKLLADPYAYDELAGRRFTREARAAARLSGHLNVVTIFDVGRTPASDEAPRGRPFIVMEHLPGGTLADALRTGELDRPLILKWLREAASALDYAHRRGVIHRDVKLSNFLLDLERVLHVADFGIAQLGTEDTLSSTGELLGTTAYLAPERALGMPATESSDRYALAVAAFELLVGERPFTAEHFAAQARQHLEEPPPLASRRNSTLPAAIDPVLIKGMAKHQDDRFASATELVQEIERALMPRHTTRPSPRHTAPSPPAMRVYSKRRGRARSRAALALVTVFIALVAGVGATVLSSAGSRTPPVRQAAMYAPNHVGPRAAGDQSRAGTATAAGSPQTGVALEAQGHQLMVGGDYASAIPVLQRAVADAPHSSLTYAYALYDLGRSLRLAGDARAAVRVLHRRLLIPNQTGVVRNELTLALHALGRSQATTGD